MKAAEEPEFEQRLNESVRRIIDYKINQGYLSVELDENWEYKVVINYPGLETSSGYEKFNTARNQNIKLYTEYFQ